MIFFVLLPLGELPEWSIGADSKSVEPFGAPGVRIPHSPQAKRQRQSALPFLCADGLRPLADERTEAHKKVALRSNAFSLAGMPAAAKGISNPSLAGNPHFSLFSPSKSDRGSLAR